MKEQKKFMVSTGTERMELKAERFVILDNKQTVQFFTGDDLIAHFPCVSWFSRVDEVQEAQTVIGGSVNQ